MVRVVYMPPEPAPTVIDEPGPIPLTHHEILALVGPFTQRNRHVDLAASDRRQRRIDFKPLEHPAQTGDRGEAVPALREVLTLKNPYPGEFQLVRTLTAPSGLTATLEIIGTDPGLLLEQVEQVAPARQFPIRAGVPIARSYRIEPRPAAGPGQAPYWQVALLRAEARVAGTILRFNAKTGRGMPLEFELNAERDQRLKVPADLFAVLGWEWRPMREIGKHWRGSVRVAKDEPARSAAAEQCIGRAIEHLAGTLARPPAEFHSRYSSARWRVTFQRAIPLLVGLGLLFATPAVRFLELDDHSLLRMLIFHSPPILMIGLFALPEMPVIELPPFPRPLTTTAWVAT
ncbi:MAG: hypothetical protein EA400_12620 [Chromatiaceae bacterium]|nr:MAG: hypothetical protein EA400_12620 [Chromatiaceae bacterium]